MHLKSLDIQGFKSFPEHTLIEFHAGVTAIVGPNGSGKSNVADAIRWVLGEQSVKTLRGGQMEDVIFNGTEQRRAMSFAEVSMTLDNRDHGLPIEYEEVEVTRRLFRSGESEYRINRSPCRLKDIVSLFMDTGLGRDGYSMIGQGQVDHILSNKSEDRRRIFEEAAGIQKYKSRRDEAVRKQERTKQNLIRVTDIINEIAAQLTPLEKQAEKARRWQQLTASLKSIEVAAILQRIDANRDAVAALIEQDRALTRDRDQAEREKARLEQAHLQSKTDLTALEDRLQILRGEQAGAREQEGRLSGRIRVCEERARQLEERRNRDDALETALKERIEARQTEVTEQSEQIEAIRHQSEDQTAQLRDLESEQSVLSDRLAETGAASARLRDRRQALQQLEHELDGERIRIKTESAMKQNQITDGRALLKRLSDQKRDAAAALQTGEAQAEKSREAVQQAEQQLHFAEQHVTDLSREQAVSQQDLQTLEQHLSQAVYRLKTLKDLDEHLAGYNDAVKALLKHIRGHEHLSARVRGTVGSLLEVPGRYELAIETALGSAVQQIVVTDRKSAGDLIDILKNNRLGRATFLPMDAVNGQKIDGADRQNLERMQGFIGIACDLVQYDADLSGVLQQLLGRIVIVDHLDHGMVMAKQIRNRFRIVTLEGDVLNVGGSMTGGYNKKRSSGLLGRSREIGDLSARIPELERGVSDAKSYIRTLDEELNDLKQEAASAGQALLLARQQLILDEASLNQLREQHSDREQAVSHQAERQRQLTAELEALSETAGQLNARLAEQAAERADVENGLMALTQSVSADREAFAGLSARISSQTAEVRAAQEQLASASALADRLKRELNDLERQLSQYDLDRNALETAVLQNTSEHHDAQHELMETRRRLETVTEDLHRAEQQKQRTTAAADDTLRRDRQVRDHLLRLESELARTENQIQRIETAQNDDKNRLWETYELTYPEADAWRNPDLDLETAEPEIQQLRGKIRALGTVNADAVAEYEQLNQRHQFMMAQQADILQSQKDLTAVIDELTLAMREQFSTNVKTINDNFKATFIELFGGGVGEIALENSDDVLTSDIEIRVCPPGKKMQNMMLLSGGERCLTAIALLFAILKLRPTPFCIMDEVEAALDDSNIFRFTDYIRKYSDQSQFILVTHRKGTMEAADRMYGVTMPEHGVSKILSLRLSD